MPAQGTVKTMSLGAGDDLGTVALSKAKNIKKRIVKHVFNQFSEISLVSYLHINIKKTS
jgi:hypothetical protein